MKLLLSTALLLSSFSPAFAEDAAPAPATVHTFTCQTGWINCMPSIGAPLSPYCSRDYRLWAKTNCGSEPMIAQ